MSCKIWLTKCHPSGLHNVIIIAGSLACMCGRRRRGRRKGKAKEIAFDFLQEQGWRSWLVRGLRCVRSRVRFPVIILVSTSLLFVWLEVTKHWCLEGIKLERIVDLKFISYYWGPLASRFSWETANCKPQKCYVATALRSRLQFAVHVWTAGRASSGKWFTARFFATKNCTASRLNVWTSFLYPFAMCLLDFLSRVNQLLLSFGWLKWCTTTWWKQHGGHKQWTRTSYQFYIFFCRTNKRKYSVPIQSYFFSILLLNS